MLEGAPLCYGALSFHSADSERCQACSFLTACGEQVALNMATVSQVLDISGMMQRHRAAQEETAALRKANLDAGKLVLQGPQPPPVKKPRAKKPSPQAQAFVGSMLAVGTLPHLQASVAKGINPFDVRATKFPYAATEMLVRGAATATNLKKLGVNYEPMYEAMTHLGLGKPIEGGLSL